MALSFILSLFSLLSPLYLSLPPLSLPPSLSLSLSSFSPSLSPSPLSLSLPSLFPSPSSLPDIHVTPVHEPKLQGASEKISKEDVDKRLEARAEELRSNSQLTEEEVQSKMKDEKVMIALEKMKLANKKKEVIKVFNNDGSNKTVVIEDGMTSAVVCYLLVTKNHFEESPCWALIERLGDVGLGQLLCDSI